MAKPENTAIAGVHKYLPPLVEREKMNNPYNAGTADVWYSADPCDLWIEYKFLEKPPVRAFTLDLSELQRQWLLRRYRQKRAVAVALLFPAKFGCVLYTHLAWGETKQKIPAPTPEQIMTRSALADLITRSCTCASCNSRFVYGSQSREGGVPHCRLHDSHLPHH